ncbi:hypothetical protein LTR84_013117 [Exophiala bonariae]|uniref:Uncharacterized protein n=1 Tax=Exophiala bonariae TaxID=1690606 RepID=A0AAV9NDW3_9EURO|nr:hypothetical protein LTR84_013117 [Exophiala bonariae]
MSFASSTVMPLALLAIFATISPTVCFPQDLSLTSATPTLTQTPTDTRAMGCVTGGVNVYMEPLVLELLGASFCSRLIANGDYPPTNILAWGSGYPSDLGPVDDKPKAVEKREVDTEETIHRRDSATDADVNTPTILNTTEMEISGVIAEFLFFRSKPYTVGDTVFIEGSDEQCARDDCAAFYHQMVNRCKFNSHVVGGFGAYLSDCGQYSYFVQNCSDNYVDPDCKIWHQRWPNFGVPENMTQVWNITHGIGSNGTAAKGAVEELAGESGAPQFPDLRGLADRFANVAKEIAWED